MCYLIAKKLDNVGSIALRTTHGKHLSQFKRKLILHLRFMGEDIMDIITTKII